MGLGVRFSVSLNTFSGVRFSVHANISGVFLNPRAHVFADIHSDVVSHIRSDVRADVSRVLA